MRKLFISICLALGFAIAASAQSTDRMPALQADALPTVQVNAASLELVVPPTADAPVKFEVFGITGQLVASVSLDSGETRTLDMRKGCYIVRSVGPDGKPVSKRFTVR